jgi:hypothetical protein
LRHLRLRQSLRFTQRVKSLSERRPGPVTWSACLHADNITGV